nr:putative phage tail assembly chaperone [uncultured Mediterranean phage uvMED]BAR21504.1 putative phage tail assembly chaperone [uncultured Mediterranean phage uvMED]BAR21541.1 putative phage tail assembly chaperone [uncultured Mediterranean phage uvMED]BAR38772.1 putative phage tail assembly chaperone [uncultured Mediterranean phage uvMED]
MASERAIDKLKQAFSIGKRSSYPIYKDGVLILQVYWTPLTIADRDSINATLIASNKGQEEGSLDFALQVIINKAEDENGQKLFAEGDKPSLRREIPLAVLLELMTKMQELGEEATPDAVKSTVS